MEKGNQDTKAGKYWLIYPKSKEAKDWIDINKKGGKLFSYLFPLKPVTGEMTAKEALEKVIEVTGVKGFSLAYIDIHKSLEDIEQEGCTDKFIKNHM